MFSFRANFEVPDAVGNGRRDVSSGGGVQQEAGQTGVSAARSCFLPCMQRECCSARLKSPTELRAHGRARSSQHCCVAV